MSNPMRLNSALIIAAELESAIQKRSVPKQIEFWAELGKAVEKLIPPADVLAVTQGLKKIKIEPVISEPMNPDDVFNSIEIRRKNGTLTDEVTSSAIYYEASLSQPGLLDKVNSATGKRQTGQFKNGEFKVL